MQTLLSGTVVCYRTYEEGVYWPHLKGGSVVPFLILRATRSNSYKQKHAFEREESLVHINKLTT